MMISSLCLLLVFVAAAMSAAITPKPTSAPSPPQVVTLPSTNTPFVTVSTIAPFTTTSTSAPGLSQECQRQCAAIDIKCDTPSYTECLQRGGRYRFGQRCTQYSERDGFEQCGPTCPVCSRCSSSECGPVPAAPYDLQKRCQSTFGSSCRLYPRCSTSSANSTGSLLNANVCGWSFSCSCYPVPTPPPLRCTFEDGCGGLSVNETYCKSYQQRCPDGDTWVNTGRAICEPAAFAGIVVNTTTAADDEGPSETSPPAPNCRVRCSGYCQNECKNKCTQRVCPTVIVDREACEQEGGVVVGGFCGEVGGQCVDYGCRRCVAKSRCENRCLSSTDERLRAVCPPASNQTCLSGQFVQGGCLPNPISGECQYRCGYCKPIVDECARKCADTVCNLFAPVTKETCEKQGMDYVAPYCDRRRCATTCPQCVPREVTTCDASDCPDLDKACENYAARCAPGHRWLPDARCVPLNGQCQAICRGRCVYDRKVCQEYCDNTQCSSLTFTQITEAYCAKRNLTYVAPSCNGGLLGATPSGPAVPPAQPTPAQVPPAQPTSAQPMKRQQPTPRPTPVAPTLATPQPTTPALLVPPSPHPTPAPMHQTFDDPVVEDDNFRPPSPYPTHAPANYCYKQCARCAVPEPVSCEGRCRDDIACAALFCGGATVFKDYSQCALAGYENNDRTKPICRTRCGGRCVYDAQKCQQRCDVNRCVNKVAVTAETCRARGLTFVPSSCNRVYNQTAASMSSNYIDCQQTCARCGVPIADLCKYQCAAQCREQATVSPFSCPAGTYYRGMNCSAPIVNGVTVDGEKIYNATMGGADASLTCKAECPRCERVTSQTDCTGKCGRNIACPAVYVSPYTCALRNATYVAPRCHNNGSACVYTCATCVPWEKCEGRCSDPPCKSSNAEQEFAECPAGAWQDSQCRPRASDGQCERTCSHCTKRCPCRRWAQTCPYCPYGGLVNGTEGFCGVRDGQCVDIPPRCGVCRKPDCSAPDACADDTRDCNREAANCERSGLYKFVRQPLCLVAPIYNQPSPTVNVTAPPGGNQVFVPSPPIASRACYKRCGSCVRRSTNDLCPVSKCAALPNYCGAPLNAPTASPTPRPPATQAVNPSTVVATSTLPGIQQIAPPPRDQPICPPGYLWRWNVTCQPRIVFRPMSPTARPTAAPTPSPTKVAVTGTTEQAKWTQASFMADTLVAPTCQWSCGSCQKQIVKPCSCDGMRKPPAVCPRCRWGEKQVVEHRCLAKQTFFGAPGATQCSWEATCRCTGAPATCDQRNCTGLPVPLLDCDDQCSERSSALVGKAVHRCAMQEDGKCGWKSGCSCVMPTCSCNFAEYPGRNCSRTCTNGRLVDAKRWSCSSPVSADGERQPCSWIEGSGSCGRCVPNIEPPVCTREKCGSVKDFCARARPACNDGQEWVAVLNERAFCRPQYNAMTRQYDSCSFSLRDCGFCRSKPTCQCGDDKPECRACPAGYSRVGERDPLCLRRQYEQKSDDADTANATAAMQGADGNAAGDADADQARFVIAPVTGCEWAPFCGACVKDEVQCKKLDPRECPPFTFPNCRGTCSPIATRVCQPEQCPPKRCGLDVVEECGAGAVLRHPVCERTSNGTCAWSSLCSQCVCETTGRTVDGGEDCAKTCFLLGRPLEVGTSRFVNTSSSCSIKYWCNADLQLEKDLTACRPREEETSCAGQRTFRECVTKGCAWNSNVCRTQCGVETPDACTKRPDCVLIVPPNSDKFCARTIVLTVRPLLDQGGNVSSVIREALGDAGFAVVDVSEPNDKGLVTITLAEAEAQSFAELKQELEQNAAALLTEAELVSDSSMIEDSETGEPAPGVGEPGSSLDPTDTSNASTVFIVLGVLIVLALLVVLAGVAVWMRRKPDTTTDAVSMKSRPRQISKRSSQGNAMRSSRRSLRQSS